MNKKGLLAALCVIFIAANAAGCSTAESEETSAPDYEAADTQESSTTGGFEEKAKITLGETVVIDGDGASLLEGDIISITQGGAYDFSGTLNNGRIYVETKESVLLTLNGVSITSLDGPAILGQDSKAIYINAAVGTENTLTDASEYSLDADGKAIGKGTIYSNDDLYFIGEGTLIVNGNYKHAIKSDDSIYVTGGSFILESVKDGMNANDTLQIDGGTVDIIDAEEGLEGDILIINDGSFTISVWDDGINSGTDMQIHGGEFYIATSGGDGLDSNGTLTIAGGLMVIHGSQMPEGGIDCDEREFVVTGGTIIADGGVNSAPSETENTQYCILLGEGEKGDTIGILDAEGNTVFAYISDISYKNMVVSVAGIKEGTQYTVYKGGTITGGTEFYGYYEQGVYEGGEQAEEFTADSMVIQAGGTVETMGGGHGGGFGGNRQEGMTPPDDAQQGERMTPPDDAQQGERMTTPDDAQQGERMTPPDNAQQGEGMTPPDNAQQGEGMTPPEGTEMTEQ